MMAGENSHVPTDLELSNIASAIGQNWEVLGTHLGLSRTTLEHIQMDNDTSVKRIHKMLLSWRQMNCGNATLATLHEAMKDATDLSVDWEAIPGRSITPSKKKQCLDHMIDKGYKQLKQQLKSDLVEFNKAELGTTAISPVREEIDAPLLELYVPPTLKKVIHSFGAEQNNVNSEPTLNDIFHEHSRRYQQIYISAEAGLGKTIFAKRIALIWCQANEPSLSHNPREQKFSEDDLHAMKDFEFVFFVSLKDLDPCDCKVDDMIQNQVVRYLARSSLYSRSFMEEVLSREQCLIILDGLDEWSHPNVGDCKMKLKERENNMPHKQSRGSCTFLTTTRPWKLIFSTLSKSKIDQQFEIVGLNESASAELTTKVTEKLKRLGLDNDTESKENDIDLDDLEKTIGGIKGNPLLIMYLTCLKLEERSFGNSMSELYSNILEMMLQRTNLAEACEPFPQKNIPGCFKDNDDCVTYFIIIQELALLAFKTLFNLNGESQLVFSNTQAREYMPESRMNFWLKTGIITQTGYNKLLSGKKTKMSFVHKTFHEFFAALYMSTTNSDLYIDEVMVKCKQVSQVLELRHTFVFLSGMCTTQSNAVIGNLVTAVSQNKDVVQFRHTTYPFENYWEMYDILEELQCLLIDCVNEGRMNGQIPDYHLRDIVLHSIPNEKSLQALKQLQSHVKLIKIGRQLSGVDVKGLLNELNLLCPESLHFVEKIDIWDTPQTEDIDLLLHGSKKSLKCLLFHGCKMEEEREVEDYIQFSDSTLQMIRSLDALQGIDLFSVKLGHDEIEELILWLEQRTCMTQIKLSRIQCRDHDGCPKRSFKKFIMCKMRLRTFDLSKHEDLKILGLGTMAMPEVTLNASKMEECWLERNQDIITYFIKNVVQTTSKLHTLVIEFVADDEVVENILNVLPQLPKLRRLQLKGMDFQDKPLVLSQWTVFEHVRLIEIKMLQTSMESLIDFLKICVKSVTTELSCCSIKSDQGNVSSNFDNLKKRIESAPEKFDILFNLRCSGHANSFAFKTVANN